MLSLIEEGHDAPAASPSLRVASIATLLLCCAPLFVLTVHRWANAVLFLGCPIALVLLLLLRRDLPVPALAPRERRLSCAMVCALAAPLAAALLSAALRGDFESSQFDAPSRFLAAIPIFLFVLRSRASVGSFMQWVLPAGLVLALALLEVAGPDPHWPTRDTTRIVDPLVFGYLTLSFGLMCLASITPREWRGAGRLGVLVRLAGLALGLYLSVRSGSRTGWLAVPIVLAAWLYHHWGRSHPMATVRAVLGALALTLATYLLVPPVAERVDEAVREAADYTWHSIPAETSVGLRITYLRIASDLFAMHPLAGVGDTSRNPPAPPSAFPYASEMAVSAAFSSAFHNQLVSNAVRNGLGGLLATAALLLVPLAICARGLRRSAAGGGKDVAMGFAFCACMVVSSFSTEIVDLKYAASFYGVMTAVLCAAALRERLPSARTSPAGGRGSGSKTGS
jgi:O-antigen ligase